MTGELKNGIVSNSKFKKLNIWILNVVWIRKLF